MKNYLRYFGILLCPFLVHTPMNCMDEDDVPSLTPITSIQTSSIKPIHLVIKNETNLNMVVEYDKPNNKGLRKLLAPGEVGDLGLFSNIQAINFFSFGKNLNSIAKKYALSLYGLVGFLESKRKQELKDKVLLVAINRSPLIGYLTNPKLCNPVNVLPIAALNSIQSDTNICYSGVFLGLSSRNDIFTSNSVMTEDRTFYQYILGVLHNHSKEDLVEAYTGLINLWTHVQEDLNEELKVLEETLRVHRNLLRTKSNDKNMSSYIDSIRAIIQHRHAKLEILDSIIRIIGKSYERLLSAFIE